MHTNPTPSTNQEPSTCPVRSRADAFEGLAHDLLAHEGLAYMGWTFRWNTRKGALGVCNFRDRIVFVSRPLFDANGDDTNLDTLAHEVAHAVAGPFTGHGPAWAREAARLGAAPVASVRANTAGDPKWRWTCGAGCEGYRHRRSQADGMICAGHGQPVVWEALR